MNLVAIIFIQNSIYLFLFLFLGYVLLKYPDNIQDKYKNIMGYGFIQLAIISMFNVMMVVCCNDKKKGLPEKVYLISNQELPRRINIENNEATNV